jgi:hypothetical protein
MGWFILDRYYTMSEDAPVYTAAPFLILQSESGILSATGQSHGTRTQLPVPVQSVKRLIVPALSLEVKSASIYKRSRDPGGLGMHIQPLISTQSGRKSTRLNLRLDL